MFGKESPAHDQRAKRVHQWAAQRTPYALFGMMFGIMAVVDIITLVLGMVLGSAAIVCGMLGLADIKRHPDRLGTKLCVASIVLGLLGAVTSLCIWAWVF